MKILAMAFGLVAFVLTILQIAGIEIAGIGFAVISASGFATAGYEYNGKEVKEVFLRGMFRGKMPSTRIIYTDGSDSVKLTFFERAAGYLMPYANGFQGGNLSGKKQKVFSLKEFKLENQYSKQDYLQIVQRELEEVKMAFQNDIFKREIMEMYPASFLNQFSDQDPDMVFQAMLLAIAEIRIFQNMAQEGLIKLFWLGDTDKITYEGNGSTTKYPNGVAYNKYDTDLRYQGDGIWKSIFSQASLTPTTDQVKKVAIVNSAVAQVQTLTLTGTSGTANVVAVGLTKLATFATDLATTAANFVTAHAADFAKRYITITNSGSTVIFTSARPGVPFDAVTIANVSGNLAGTVAATTANVVSTAMTANQAIDLMAQMAKAQPIKMKSLPSSRKVFYATQTWIDNYKDTLGASGAGAGASGNAALQTQRDVMINGIDTIFYNGIPIEEMPIDDAISADFAGYSPHRCILTIRENLAPVLSTPENFAQWKLWFNDDENATRNRLQLEFGADFVYPEYMVACFQG